MSDMPLMFISRMAYAILSHNPHLMQLANLENGKIKVNP